MLGLDNLSRRLFGTPSSRKVKALRPQVDQINALEADLEKLSDDELRARTEALKARAQGGESLDALLIDAFATVREGAKRTLGQRHFDVQLIGGMVLHQGKISEMKTGEGKTLVATLAVYLNALAGKGVHVITVNDYLARRDADWMGQIYRFLGMTVGCIVHGLDDDERRAAYACDITYGTNNEFGFDYLRDNMKYSVGSMVQRGHHYAIVDEVDSILIDEARTPLIISGPSEDHSSLYTSIDALMPSLVPEDFDLDEKARTVHYTDVGTEHIETLLREAGLLTEGSLYDIENISLVHHIQQALRAHKLFSLDRDYIVKDGKVVLIDEFTGRMMVGRRFSEGLHQALEAKEKVHIEPENVTLASITFQNYFRMYKKLAGMTGTALTEAEEFQNIYGLDVVEIPTHTTVARIDEDDEVYRSEAEKLEAIIREIKDARERSQPVLVGTTSIEKSELLSEMLKKEGVEHQVLNARYHEQEAYIVAQAGRSGAITIATNMAGRGTDIQLGGNAKMRIEKEWEEGKSGESREAFEARVRAEIETDKQKVLAAGGLYVIGSERHESRRIDNQLRGRSGRQGDPGRSKFFLSLQDDLMRIFGGERMDAMLTRLGLQQGEAIVHTWINKGIEKAQQKVEARNFDMRKNVLKYDDVMNDQRLIIFEQRVEFMNAPDVSETVSSMAAQLVDELVTRHVPEKAYPEQWDTAGLEEQVRQILNLDLPIVAWSREEGIAETDLRERIDQAVLNNLKERSALFGDDLYKTIEKTVLLQTLDHLWREHLIYLDYLRHGVGLRGYAQRDPLNEYKSEAFELFESMLRTLREDVLGQLSRVRPAEPPPQLQELPRSQMVESHINPDTGENAIAPDLEAALKQAARAGNIPRNAPCPCGSGKKFKHCHGQI